MASNLRISLNKFLLPIRQRIVLLLSRGVGHLANAGTPMQTLQVELFKGEVLDGVEHLEPYGFTSHPHPGHEVLVASFAGNRRHSVIVVAADRRYRKKDLLTGESALYTDEGDYILMKRGRIIEVVAGTRLKVTAPTMEIVGNATVSGSLTVEGAILSSTSIADPVGTLAEARGYYNSHTHPGGGTPSPQMT